MCGFTQRRSRIVVLPGYDGRGSEIGDDCAFVYGSGFGGSPGAEYDQTINGGHYFIQEEFSNQNFAANKKGACIQQVDLPTATGLKVKSSAKVGKVTTMKVPRPLDVTSYSWDFGDGSPLGTSAAVTHVYTSPGTYTVTLTLTDVIGLQNTTSLLTGAITVR